MKLAVSLILLLVVVCLVPHPALAQATREGRLIVTVVDSTGAVLPNAKVTVVGVDEATKKRVIPPAMSSDKGVATFEHLVPGTYSITGEFEGFDIGLLKDQRIKAGDNRHVLVLPLKKFAEEITVGRDRQMVAAERGTTFGTALTREQVDALSDDPDEMKRQLQDMAPDAAIRVDSFEGQQLPPKAQIKAVHITRDSFAAENHYSGAMFIDIITQPGIGPLTGRTGFSFYNSALDGQNPLIPKKGPAQNLSFNGGLQGSLAKEKASFSISVSRFGGYTTPNMYAQTLQGIVAQNIDLHQSSDSYYVSGLFDYALTKDQTLRASYNYGQNWSSNRGVGAYDFPERAYSSNSASHNFRIQEAGPIGRRFFINTRLNMNVGNSSSSSVLEAPTIIVNDAYTSGGAQQKGGRQTVAFTLNSDLDYVRGINSVRSGIQIDGGRYHSDSNSNYLGTYIFGCLTPNDLCSNALSTGTPQTYTRRIGDPNIGYWNGQFAYYLQDDLRIRKNLTISPGVRLEAQTHVDDTSNIGPRIGITWAPFKSGKTTLRASWGIFYDWYSTSTYEQTLRVDGYRQRQVNIINTPLTPLGYPDPGSVAGLPTDRYLVDPSIQLARNNRASAGVQQQVTKWLRLGATYANTLTDGLLSGTNLNSPVNGVRPDPNFVNVIEASSQGQTRSHSLSVNGTINLAPTSPTAAMSGPLLSWKRGLSIYTSYYFSRYNSDSTGAFGVPASGTLATEWGPYTMQRGSIGIYTNALKNLTASLNFSGNTGSPYTIMLPNDANGDGLFNDRPAGVARNTLKGPGFWNLNGFFTYSIGFGKKTVTGSSGLPGGIMIVSSGSGGMMISQGGGSGGSPRYRMTINVFANNLTNHANYNGYSGIIGSPFFMRPTGVDGVRTLNLSVGFNF